jgi:hypothetical protein
MAGPPSNCPRCDGSMDRGYVLDEGYGKRGPAKWIEGPPEFGMWTGLKIRGHRRIEVATYRCRTCGYLESYALE